LSFFKKNFDPDDLTFFKDVSNRQREMRQSLLFLHYLFERVVSWYAKMSLLGCCLVLAAKCIL